MKETKVRPGTKPIMLKEIKVLETDGTIRSFKKGHKVYGCEHWTDTVTSESIKADFNKASADDERLGGKATLFICNNICIARMKRATMKIAGKE